MNRPHQYSRSDSKCIREMGYCEEKNYPFRQAMQDYPMDHDPFLSGSSALFGILDGHGGNGVAQYCQQALPGILEAQLSKTKDAKEGIARSFAIIDDQLKLVGANDTGSTCCLAYINAKLCTVANLGDTRAVLCEKGVAKRVSVDHKPTLQSQVQRIKQEGGVVVNGRLSGKLAVTRAFGDLQLKGEGLSIKPDFCQFQINQRTQFLIMASDGLWDVCDDSKAIELCKAAPNCLAMANGLVKFAKNNGSKDNISVIVIKF